MPLSNKSYRMCRRKEAHRSVKPPMMRFVPQHILWACGSASLPYVE